MGGLRFTKTFCSPGCIAAQLKAYHEQEGVGVKPDEKIPASPSGNLNDETAKKAWKDFDAKDRQVAQPTQSRGRNH